MKVLRARFYVSDGFFQSKCCQYKFLNVMNAKSDDKCLLRYDKTGYIYPLSYSITVKCVFLTSRDIDRTLRRMMTNH